MIAELLTYNCTYMVNSEDGRQHAKDFILHRSRIEPDFRTRIVNSLTWNLGKTV